MVVRSVWPWDQHGHGICVAMGSVWSWDQRGLGISVAVGSPQL